MHVLHIEYPILDYDAWKVAFDDDRLDRRGSGVRRYRIFRPIDDPNYGMIDLEFDDAGEAEVYLAALRRVVYSSQEGSSSLEGGVRRRASSRWWRPMSTDVSIPDIRLCTQVWGIDGLRSPHLLA